MACWTRARRKFYVAQSSDLMRAMVMLAYVRLLYDVEREAKTRELTSEAIAFTRGNWATLKRYTQDGDLEIDNNGAERSLRGLAVGRKNWMFYGSDQGGQIAAILTSFTATYKRLQIDPFLYLREVFERISAHPAHRLAKLLPDRWKAARANDTS